MTQRILMVDDEPRVLDGIRRNLHDRYEIDIATSGPDGLALVSLPDNPYAVVVSDMMMPGMNGAEFLTRAHDISPDAVQMILSGQAEVTSTIAAVNNGNLFRFLTKPCEPDDLARAIDAALAQHQLVRSERELLERTLDGAVEVLTEIMSMSHPVAFNRTEVVKGLCEALVAAVPVARTWELRIASMLGQLGLASVPEVVVNQVREGSGVSAENLEIYRGHPRLAFELIQRIPRLEHIAGWVAAQPVTFDDAMKPTGDDGDDENGGADGMTARTVYATVMAFVVGVDEGLPASSVVHELAATGRYPRQLLDLALNAYGRVKVRRPRDVLGSQLTVGMVVNHDVLTTTGLTLVKKGEVLTESTAIRLRHFAEGVGVVEPINVS